MKVDRRAFLGSVGGAGAIEAAFCALAIRDQIMPPTLNLDNPSVETDIDLIPHKAKKGRVRAAVSNFTHLWKTVIRVKT